MDEERKTKKYFRTSISRGLEKGKDAIDRENNIIHGFAVMTRGFVQDMRGWEIDDLTLEQLSNAGNESKLGIKARFGHPNMSSTALGTFLGRARSFRKEGDIVRADLHFSDTAFNTPNGDLASYVMDLAESEPDMFGASVVLSEADLEFRLNEDGTRQKDEKGNDLPPVLRVKKISGADVVDEPAANQGFFSKEFFSDSTLLSSEMSEFLNKFLSDPEAVESTISFLSRYQTNKDQINEHVKGDDSMELNMKELTVEVLKTERTDLVEAIQSEVSPDQEITQKQLDQTKADAEKLGVTKERERIIKILNFGKTPEFKVYDDLIFASIEKGDSFETVEKDLMRQRMDDLSKEAPKSPGPGEEDYEHKLSSMPEGEEKWKLEFERSGDLQKEFSSVNSYVAYKRAVARNAVVY